MSIEAMAEDVARLMAARLKIDGTGLAAKLGRSRRVLPREIRAEAQMLVDAAALAGAPKLARQLDQARLAEAHEICRAYLEPMGRAERRRGMVLGMLGSLGLVVIVTFALVLAVLLWRGYL